MRPRLMKGTGRVFHVELLHGEADGRGLCNAAGCAGHRNGVCARRGSRITAAATTAVPPTAACRQAGAEGEQQQERACERLPPPPLRGNAEQQNQSQRSAAG